MISVRRVVAAATLVSALVFSGCTGSDGTEAGMGLPTLDAEASAAALTSAGVEEVELLGELSVEPNGCFTWRSGDAADGAWLVWPDGARHEDDEVVLGSGTRVGEGDRLDGTGGLVALSELPDGANADSYFGSFGGFCDADERGVVVLVDVSAH